MLIMGSTKVGVLGAGIVGVTTAMEAISAFPSLNVTLIADRFNEDTTSNGAAGIFRPGTSFSGPTPEITRRWLVDAYDYYNNLLCEDCGVSRVSGYIFSSTSPDIVRNHLLEGLVPVYRRVTEDELESSPSKWKYGSYFETLLTECNKFLPWGLNKLRAAGVPIVKRYVEQLGELKNQFDIIINCTGLGAKQLISDHKVVPIRGQVLKVMAPWVKHFYYADYDTYVIPGSGGLVTLGGSRHYDSHTTTICCHDLAAINERCLALVPSLADAPVIKTWAGLRPHRDSVRLEYQLVNNLKVIHNYGHGGYGVTSAPGTAKHAIQILQNVMLSNSKL